MIFLEIFGVRRNLCTIRFKLSPLGVFTAVLLLNVEAIFDNTSA